VRLERYVTLKRNSKLAKSVDEIDITLNDVQELLRITESMKTLLRGVVSSSNNITLNENIKQIVNELFESQQIK